MSNTPLIRIIRHHGNVSGCDPPARPAGGARPRRDLDAHLAEAVRKGWHIVPTADPKIFFDVGGNLLRRARGYDRVIEGLRAPLSLLITVDNRISTTALSPRAVETFGS